MAWMMLAGAGLLEIVWATALKESEGFTRLWPSVIGISTSSISLVVLAFALRSLPVGTAYAAWVGIGAGGVAIVGIVHFGDAATPQRILCFVLILSGVVGLRVLDG